MHTATGGSLKVADSLSHMCCVQALHALMKDDTDVLCMLGMLRMLQDKHESAADAFAAAVRLSMVSTCKSLLPTVYHPLAGAFAETQGADHLMSS